MKGHFHRGEISLREVRETDLPTFYNHQADPEATRMACFPPRARDAFMAHWARCMAEKTAILRTIVVRGEVAGNVVSWEQSGERRVGYWLGREYWGKGIATAALEAFLVEVKTRPLHACVVKSNVGSLKVLQKCGFEICGEETFCDDGVPGSEFILILQKRFG